MKEKTRALYFIPDLVSAWDVSEKWLGERLRSGELRGRKLGRRWAVTAEEKVRFEAASAATRGGSADAA